MNSIAAKHYNILLIDDQPTMIKVYEMAFNEVMKSVSHLDFNMVKALDYYSGIKKIKQIINIKGEHIIVLDIGLGKSKEGKNLSGEDLGIIIRELIPNAKIIVSTFYTEAFKINSIFRNVNPMGFLVKSDFKFNDLKEAIKNVISGNPYYSNLVNKIVRKKYQIYFLPDKIDKKILYELSIGTKMKEMTEFIPSMSLGGIEKRRRRLKQVFNVENKTDRALVLAAIDNGFI